MSEENTVSPGIDGMVADFINLARALDVPAYDLAIALLIGAYSVARHLNTNDWADALAKGAAMLRAEPINETRN